jgi:hypothetical protein
MAIVFFSWRGVVRCGAFLAVFMSELTGPVRLVKALLQVKSLFEKLDLT